MKKTIAIILAAALALSLAACGGNAVPEETSAPPAVETPVPPLDNSGLPDNEFTQQIPIPSFLILGAGWQDGSYVLMFEETSIEALQAYVEELKAAGFTPIESMKDGNGNLTEVPDLGFTFEFIARNEAGYEVAVIYVPGSSGIAVKKLDE